MEERTGEEGFGPEPGSGAERREAEHVPPYPPEPPDDHNDSSPVGIVYDKRMELHRNTLEPMHVDNPLKVSLTVAQLRDMHLLRACRRVPSRPATNEELQLVHTQEQVQLIDSCSTTPQLLDSLHGGSDVFSTLGSADAARIAAGSLAQLTTLVAQEELRCGFAVLRPPGHHCTGMVPSGFCLYNNVAVAARAAQQALRRKRSQATGRPQPAAVVRPRILIFDWDVHHGNGTESIFYDDSSVMVISVHGHLDGHPHRVHPKVSKVIRKKDRADCIGMFQKENPQKELPPDLLPRSARKQAREDAASAAGSAASGAGPGAGAADAAPRRDSDRDSAAASAAGSAAGEPAEEKPLQSTKRRRTSRGDYVTPSAGGASAPSRTPVAAAAATPAAAATDAADDESTVRSASSSAASETMSSPTASSSSAPSSSSETGSEPQSSEDFSGTESEISVEPEADPKVPRFYPATGDVCRIGIGQGMGRNVNVALPCSECGDLEYLAVIDEIVLPLGRAFDPELVIISAGFDAALHDPLGKQRVTPSGFARMTRALGELAGGRMVVATEGGYNAPMVALCAEAVLRELLQLAGAELPEGAPRSRTIADLCSATVRGVHQTQSVYWGSVFPAAPVDQERTGGKA